MGQGGTCHVLLSPWVMRVQADKAGVLSLPSGSVLLCSWQGKLVKTQQQVASSSIAWSNVKLRGADFGAPGAGGGKISVELCCSEHGSTDSSLR